MTDLKIHVGDRTQDFADRFVDAWRRAERGEKVDERHLSFETFEAMTRVLTPRRLELLRRLHGRPTADIDALAEAVGRDSRQVHEDVAALISAGLVDQDERSPVLSAPYDAIATRIAL